MIRKEIIDLFRIRPGKPFRLNDHDPGWAPWYVIPADQKWVTRAVVADIITTTIHSLQLRYPEVTEVQLVEFAKLQEQLGNE
ncbi:hypothetical protein Spb1_16980 [Planctopirus ephydatiae]|uniref:Uncharacterized protein n=1 Tax=Planctopirus ephydatiae TaxID=2528019 RepID=A0A518GMW8_9PLAN|nr:hypothetical protein [Planctopirus ephydatiae]QDV29781.1 hypothetical protein Spb1_16980 [Planctopirus ephydatiae]